MSEPINTKQELHFSDRKGNTKRIFTNSVALFLRMIFVSIINIYSVRFILKGLGIIDYGVYYAISSVVLMGTFLIPVLSSSLQRFYSYFLGKKDHKALNSLFSISCNIVLALSTIILLVLEIVGLWYIQKHLNIPADRANVALWVYQAAIFTFIATIWLIPFTALIFSHEDMKIYAVLSCIDCALKFAAALMTTFIDGHNALLYYATAIIIISLILVTAYYLVARKKYSECEYKLVTEKFLYKKVLAFSGWTLYGALAGTTMIQGSVITLNFFFGPLANAAFAVANNLYNAFNSLANSVALSFKPAMVKLYAEGNTPELGMLFYLNNKLLLYMMAAVSIPIIAEMRTILSLWLGNYTEDMVIYCRLFVIYTLCQVMHHPITTIIQSTGDVKKYFVYVETLMILSLPINIILFKIKLPSYYLFVTIIICCIMSYGLRIICLKKKMRSFSVIKYVRELIIPGFLILFLSFMISYIIHHTIAHDLARLTVEIIVIPTLLVALTFLFGITQVERKGIMNLVTSKLRK